MAFESLSLSSWVFQVLEVKGKFRPGLLSLTWSPRFVPPLENNPQGTKRRRWRKKTLKRATFGAKLKLEMSPATCLHLTSKKTVLLQNVHRTCFAVSYFVPASSSFPPLNAKTNKKLTWPWYRLQRLVWEGHSRPDVKALRRLRRFPRAGALRARVLVRLWRGFHPPRRVATSWPWRPGSWVDRWAGDRTLQRIKMALSVKLFGLELKKRAEFFKKSLLGTRLFRPVLFSTAVSETGDT